MNKKTSIQQKISKQMLTLSISMIAVLCLVLAVGLWILSRNILAINDTLGKTAAAGSKEALTEQAFEQLSSLAHSKALLSEEKLSAAQDEVGMAAAFAADILQHPDDYAPVEVLPADSRNKGKAAAQLVTVEDNPPEWMLEEAAQVGIIQRHLISMVENTSNIVAAYVGYENHFAIFADYESTRISIEPTERSWYISAKEKGDIIWSDVYDDIFGRGLCITCAAPFYDADGTFAGVIGIDLLVGEFNDFISNDTLGKSGYAFIVNENGDVIVSPNIHKGEDGTIIRDNILTDLGSEFSSVGKEMIAGHSSIQELTIDGKQWLIAYAPFDVVPWSIAELVPKEEAIERALAGEQEIVGLKTQAAEKLMTGIVIIFIFLAAAALLLIALTALRAKKLAKNIATPIISFRESVAMVAAGDLGHRIEMNTGDEIEELANAFNKMAGDIQTYIKNLASITAEKERIGAELNVATQIQSSMLPCIFPAFPDRSEFDIYGYMLPAKEVGGDFYDFFLIDDTQLAIVMADVSGKGIPAALFMVIAKTLIKNNAQSGKSPSEVFETVNNMLCESNDAGMFVTAFIGILDIASGRFTYANAGHNPPLIKRRDCDYEWLPVKPGFVLAGMGGISYRQDEITLKQGDMLYLYTDGVTEAVNKEDELFTEAHLLQVVNRHKAVAMNEFIPHIKAEIDLFADGAEQADDITMVIMKITEA